MPMPAFAKHQQSRFSQWEISELSKTENALHSHFRSSGPLKMNQDEKRVQKLMQRCVLSRVCFLYRLRMMETVQKIVKV